MKKIIRILFVCLFFIALIFIGKNVLKDGKEREYIKSDKYYEENIENININEVNFKFLQVNEVANVNEAFYKKYDSYKEVVVEDNKNYDVFEKYTKVDVAFDQGYSGMRCYLNEDESFGGAYFRYTFEYETNDENLVDSSIEVYITAEPLEKFEGLLPTIEEADEGNVYSIYDNILYYMENDDNMSLFKTNISTVIFVVLQMARKNLISINIVMFYITFFNKCINDKTIKIIVIYEMNLQDIQYFINYYLYKCPITQFSSTAGDITRVVNYKDINLNKNDVFNAVVPAYVDDEQNNEIEGSTTEYELKSPDGKEINPDQNLSGEDAKSAYYMVTVEVDSDEHGIAIGQGIRQEQQRMAGIPRLMRMDMQFQMMQYRKSTTSITISGSWKKAVPRPDTSGTLTQSAL